MVPVYKLLQPGVLRRSWMLRSVDDLLFTDVSGQPICPIFKGQAVQEECSLVPGSRNTFRLLTPMHTRDHIRLGGLPEFLSPQHNYH